MIGVIDINLAKIGPTYEANIVETFILTQNRTHLYGIFQKIRIFDILCA